MGDAILPALKSAAEQTDPAAARLAESFAARAAKAEGGGEQGSISGFSVGGGGASGSAQGADETLALLPAPSPEAQSILVDLGRTAVKVNKHHDTGGATC